MKQEILSIFLIMFMSMIGVRAFASDIAVENADGVTICYNYINDGTELEVTYSYSQYSGIVNIPESVLFMGRTRSVTRISDGAFMSCYELTSVNTGNSIKQIGNDAFHGCFGLTTVNIGDNVTSIGYGAFYKCSSLTSISMGKNVKEIDNYAFGDCWGLTSVHISDLDAWCSISFRSESSNPLYYAQHLFLNGEEIVDLVIPQTVASIADYSFTNCSGLKSLTIPSNVTKIGKASFQGCSGLSSISIPNSITIIGKAAFSEIDMLTVVSLIEEPFAIVEVFSLNTFNNATLYVPKGTIDKYKSTFGWKSFHYIEEGNGGTNPSTQKCEKPTITYQNGKLSFNCATEEATFHSTITDSDITSYNSNEVQLTATYNISVYASKAGYENSDVVTAKLCWIDVEPKTEGLGSSVSLIRANAVLIQTDGGRIAVTGAEDGTRVAVYEINGQHVGSATSIGANACINTNLAHGSIAIVKIGEKSVKVVVK